MISKNGWLSKLLRRGELTSVQFLFFKRSFFNNIEGMFVFFYVVGQFSFVGYSDNPEGLVSFPRP